MFSFEKAFSSRKFKKISESSKAKEFEQIMLKTVKSLDKNSLSSTQSYLIREMEFIENLDTDEAPLEHMEYQTQRMSQTIFKSFKENIFWKVLQTFDNFIGYIYLKDIVYFLEKNCNKFHIIQKNVNIYLC